MTGDITTVSRALTDSAFENAVLSEIEHIFDFCENNTDKIRKDIEKAGFSCTYCGRCCQREEADNSVFLLPQEIEKIENASGLNRTDFILPLFPDFYTKDDVSSIRIEVKRFAEIVKSIPDRIDEEGRIHTFGWMLQRDESGRCIFLNSDSVGAVRLVGSAEFVKTAGANEITASAGANETAESVGAAGPAGIKRCGIYDVRPGLCQTYPFYLVENGIEDCQCEGLSRSSKTDTAVSNELTQAVMKRLLAEQDDLLRTRQYVKTECEQVLFNTERGLENALNDLKAGVLKFIVYDGRGIHHTKIRIPEFESLPEFE